jgi:asparagine synthase (glutamine-hydrolysing)
VLGERTGVREGAVVPRKLALLLRAGARSAADAFVYDRAFRRLRAGAYAPALRSAIGDWHPDALYRDAWSRADGVDDVDRALYGDLTTYLPDQLLAKSDVSAMAHGLETRSPFLGREILEYAATLPTSLRLHGWTTKYLLKRVAERYMPGDALQRRKQGFVIPASDWLRGDLAPLARATLDASRFFDRGWIRREAVRTLLDQHASGRRDWGQQIWTLVILEIWAQLTLDGTLAPSDPLDVELLAGSAR